MTNMSTSFCWWFCSTRQHGRRNASHILALLTSLYLLATQAVAPTQAQISNCSRANPDISSNCSLGKTFFNAASGCCEHCNKCSRPEMFVGTQCTLIKDSVCMCRQPLFLTELNECLTDCTACPSSGGVGQCIPGTQNCRCPNPECYLDHDKYCRNKLCPTTAPTNTTTPNVLRNTSPGTNSLPSWGFGLIAIGIVIGIIIFASCFLCMGLSTLRGKRAVSQDGSENSENGLVGGSVISIGTNSSYLMSTTGSVYPYLSSHNMLELLKNSNSQLVLTQNGSLSSIQNNSSLGGNKKFEPCRHKEDVSSLQSSPLSMRANLKSPVSSRTVKPMGSSAFV